MTTRALLLSLVLVGCGPVDVLVVNVPDASTLDELPGKPCQDSDDCAGGQFCSKATCSDSLGQCALRPQVIEQCDREFHPECGCDGVQYLNDCYRRFAGVAANQVRGQCQPVLCDLSAPCGEGQYCARLVRPNECGRLTAGQCWAVPASGTCMTLDRFIPCGGGACMDFCSAVRSEQPVGRMPGMCP